MWESIIDGSTNEGETFGIQNQGKYHKNQGKSYTPLTPSNLFHLTVLSVCSFLTTALNPVEQARLKSTQAMLVDRF
jgi:hypothetical protein